MLAHLYDICPTQKATSTNNTRYNLCQSPDSALEKRITEYCLKHPEQLQELEETPPKERKQYKQRRWRGHSYGKNLLVHTAYLFQSYYFAFGLEGGKINPSQRTLAKQLSISIRTLYKALKILREMGVITWISGKKTWETNIYTLEAPYRTTPMRRPHGFKIPKILWLKIQYVINKKRFKDLAQTIYEHFLKDIADYTLRVYKYLRTSFEEGSKNIFKSSNDPPKAQKKPPSWHLLKQFSLPFKDQWVIGRYGEAVLRQAIDDLKYYQTQGKEVSNVAAFLTSRCKAHKEKMVLVEKGKNRVSAREWVVSYFKAHFKRFNFISDKSDIDRQADDLRPFIELKFHKQDESKSTLKIYQKVCGQWIDKMFTFDRPDFINAVENYLESSLKQEKLGCI